MLSQNCLVETIDMLPHNIGYLKLNGFGDAAVCRETTDRGMRPLNSADALIVDLRNTSTSPCTLPPISLSVRFGADNEVLLRCPISLFVHRRRRHGSRSVRFGPLAGT
jgi:hypothetical protein